MSETLADQLRKATGVAAAANFNIQYGFREGKLLIIFPEKIDNLQLTPEQTTQMMDALTKTLAIMKEKGNG